MTAKPVTPTDADIAKIEDQYGPLQPDATTKQRADRWRLYQAAALIRMYPPKWSAGKCVGPRPRADFDKHSELERKLFELEANARHADTAKASLQIGFGRRVASISRMARRAKADAERPSNCA